MLTILQFAAKFNSSVPGTLPTRNSSEYDIRNVTDAQIDSITIDLRTTSTSAVHITTLVANSTRGTHTATTTTSTMMTIFDSPSTIIALTVGGTIILNISIMI